MYLKNNLYNVTFSNLLKPTLTSTINDNIIKFKIENHVVYLHTDYLVHIRYLSICYFNYIACVMQTLLYDTYYIILHY